jgi:hypothetical protein
MLKMHSFAYGICRDGKYDEKYSSHQNSFFALLQKTYFFGTEISPVH